MSPFALNGGLQQLDATTSTSDGCVVSQCSDESRNDISEGKYISTTQPVEELSFFGRRGEGINVAAITSMK